IYPFWTKDRRIAYKTLKEGSVIKDAHVINENGKSNEPISRGVNGEYGRLLRESHKKNIKNKEAGHLTIDISPQK
ncbi:MAG: hypothetical protein KKA79_06845, partial [Nanoarchaeota archaeon]|nr:hypothetical protein [Nanoarchaeota archaeon]